MLHTTNNENTQLLCLPTIMHWADILFLPPPTHKISGKEYIFASNGIKKSVVICHSFCLAEVKIAELKRKWLEHRIKERCQIIASKQVDWS